MMRDRDWLDELIRAGELVRTKSTDSNGNPIYCLPPGEDGRRLKRLLDQRLQSRASQRREGSP